MRTAQNISYVVALAHFSAGQLNQKYRLASHAEVLVWSWDAYLDRVARNGETPRNLTLQMMSPNIVICGFCFVMAVVFFRESGFARSWNCLEPPGILGV